MRLCLTLMLITLMVGCTTTVSIDNKPEWNDWIQQNVLPCGSVNVPCIVSIEGEYNDSSKDFAAVKTDAVQRKAHRAKRTTT